MSSGFLSDPEPKAAERFVEFFSVNIRDWRRMAGRRAFDAGTETLQVGTASRHRQY
jgi:hypothetical protein